MHVSLGREFLSFPHSIFASEERGVIRDGDADFRSHLRALRIFAFESEVTFRVFRDDGSDSSNDRYVE